MRQALLFGSVLVALWIVGCNPCTARTEDRFVPTSYPTQDQWDFYAFGDGCSVPKADEMVTSTKTGKPCWTDLEAHADEWKALPCEDACRQTTVL